MATVEQIRKRLESETGYYVNYAPASSATTMIPVVKENEVLKPVRKVSAAGIAGALSILIVYVLGITGVDVTEEVASAITAILAFAAGYIVPASASDEPTE